MENETVVNKKDVLSKVFSCIAFAYGFFHFYTAGFGAYPNIIQRSIHVGMAIILAFAYLPAKKKKVKWWEILIIIAVIFSISHFIINYRRILINPLYAIGYDVAISIFLVIAILEATRRTLGYIFPALALLSLIYGVYGSYFPGIWAHRGMDLTLIMEILFLSTDGVWGITTRITSTIIAIFIIFGAMITTTGIGKIFIDIVLLLAGRTRGGGAKVAAIASGIFGSISGSAAANVAVTGSITIPLMKQLGYDKDFAAATESTASTGGQFMPPIMGAGAFIMAEFLGISYYRIILHALIPAFIFYAGLIISIHFYSHRANLVGLKKEMLPKRKEVLTYKNVLKAVTPIIVLLYLLYRGYTPMLAGFWATITVIVPYLLSDLDINHMKERFILVLKGIEKGGRGLIIIGLLAASAQIIISMIIVTGFAVKISNLILAISSEGLIFALFMSMILCMIMGMGMPTTAAYVLSVTIAGPALVALGVELLSAHLFIYYFAIMSAITPPVCAAIFVAAPMAESNWLRSAFIAIKLGIGGFIVPFLFVYSPALILLGSFWEIVSASVSTLLAVTVLGGVSMGYFVARNKSYEVIILCIGSLLLVLPGVTSNILGFIIVAVIYYLQFLRIKQDRLLNITPSV